MFNARITFIALFISTYAHVIGQPALCSVGFDQLSPNTAEFFTPGSRFADADNDGDLDFFAFRSKVPNNTYTLPPEIRIFQNNGTSFSLFTTLNTDRFDLADINGDGRLDLVSIDPDIGNSLRLYLNTGTSFTLTPIYTAPTNVTFAGSPEFVDYDNDGDLDISCGVFRRSNGAVFILENDGFLGFSQRELFSISGSGRNTVTDVKWRDIDNDGDQDCWGLFDGVDAAGTLRTFPDIYMNQGDGTFNSAAARPPSADRSLLEDFDNDGTVDMIVWGNGLQSDNPGASFRYYRGGASGTNGFVGSISTGDNENIWDIVTFDFDNNGYLDLMAYTSNAQTFNRRYIIYRNTGGTTFIPDIFGPSTTFSAPYFADFSKDNTADYAAADFIVGANTNINFFRGNQPQSTCPSNSRPNAPTSLSAQVNGNSVSLSWLSSDANQNTASLTYEIFLRNQTTGQILHAPSSDQTTGLRKVAAPGRHGSSGSWTFNNLPDGQYAWQVQAIDHFYSGSPWAAGDFQIGTAPCPAYTLDRETDSGFSRYSKFADFDNDGDKDLIIIQDNGDNPPQLHILQNKEGTLPLLDPWNENQILAEHFDLGDADNDGDIDIVFVDNTAIYLLVNNSGTFERKEIFNSVEGWTTSRPAFLDYDNDGDLDVVHYNSVFFTQFNGLAFYENRGDLDFGPGTDYPFSENVVADLRVADIDNDGDTDVITEERNPFIPDLPHQINIYLNEEGTFTLGPNVGSTGQGLGGFDIGDIDNDGDLDVVGSGLFQFGSSTRFYLNDNLNFIEVPVLDQGFGHLRLGDYNNDGFLDLAASTFVYTSSPTAPNVVEFTQLFQNTGGTSLVAENINFSVPNLAYLKVGVLPEWVDFNNDGILDIYQQYFATYNETNTETVWRDRGLLYLNESTCEPNTAPSPPSGLDVDINGSDVLLNWKDGSDPEQPSNSLSYKAFLYDVQNQIFLQPHAHPDNGYRQLVQLGNQYQTRSWLVKGLADGDYCFKVQAIDHVYEGSSWSEELCFTILNCQLTAEAIAIPPVICEGETANLRAISSGGIGTVQYQWNNGLGTGPAKTVTPTSTTVYQVTATDEAGCTATDTAVVVVNPLPSVVASPDTAICEGASLTLSATASGGSGGNYQFLWDNGLGAGATHTVTPTVSTDYAVAVRDGNGCTNTDTANVIVNQRPTVVAAPDTTICEGETITLVATAGGGSDGYTFSWDNGLGNGPSHDVSPDTTTTYSVTVTDAFGCADRDQATIIVNPLPSVEASPDTNVCQGEPVILIATPSGGSGGNYQFLWDNGLGAGPTHTVTPSVDTDYAVILRDGNNCTATDTANVFISLPPVVIAEPDTAICLGESVTVSATASGGAGGYTFAWDNGLGNGPTHTVSPDATTTYSVTVTDENGCTATDEVTVTVNPLPIVNLGPDTSICLGEELLLFASATGGDGNYTFTWDNGLLPEQSQNLSPTVLTTYAVVLEDGNGCTDTDSITVLVNPLPGIEIVSVNCDPSLTTYRVEVQVESTHTLSAAVGEVIDNGGGSFSITSIPAGTDLILTITDPNVNCSIQETVTAPDCSCPTDIPPPLSGGDQSYCQGDDIPALSVTVPDTLSVNWFDAASGGQLLFQSSTTYTPTAPGTYYAEAFVISNGCPSLSRTAVTLIELAPPPVSILGDTIICAGETTILTATGADTYLWNTGATSETIEVGAAGTYTVTGTDANGCTATATVQVTVSESLEASFDNQDVLCNGDATGTANVQAFGGTPPYTYNWSNQATGSSNPGLTAGTYFLTITDSNDCTLETSTEITEPEAIVIAVTTDSVRCSGGADGRASLSITGGTPGYNVLWPDQSTALSRTDLSAGSYEVSVSDINQCATTVSVLIDEPDPIFIEPLSVQDVSCAGASNGSINILVGGGTAPYDIQWSNGSTGTTVENLAAGSYEVSVTDANDCLTSASFTINQPQTLEISDAQIGSATCEGASDGSINLTISGGTPPYNFDWSDGSTTEDLVGVPAGTYSVEITDQNQCDVRGNFTIGNATTIFLSLNSTDATCGENNGFVDLSIDGGTAPFSFDWNNDGIGDNDDSEDLEELGAGEYFVSLTDVNGCVAFSDTATVNAIAPAIIEIVSVTPSICDAATGAIDIEVSGGTPPYNYTWSNQSNSQDLSQVPEGTYTIIVTDQNDCSISEEIVIGCTNPCSVAVGRMGTEKLMGCENEVLTATYDSEGEVIGEGEIRQFILHTAPGNSLGDVIFAILDEPTVFFIESQMQAGVEYYISAVVGKDNGNGQVDLSNDCLVVAPGTPFSFATAPTAPAELSATNTVLCSGQTLDLAVNVPLDGEISYLWETPRGAFVTDEPELQLENFTAEDIGDYFASYNINGCESDQLGPLFVTLDESAAAVSGGEDILSCGDTEVNMAATLPAGTTGTWFTSSPARILEPDNPNTVVDSLISGDNIFIWIVNTGSCIVRDSVTVYHAVNPSTQDKDVLLQADKAALLLNKELLFDAITQTIPDSQLTFTIIKEPEFGVLSDSLAGLYYLRDFDVQEDIEVSFTYEVCNNDPECGALCSQANINLTVKFLASEIISYKQALRPNGNNPVWNFTLLRNLSDAKITIVDRWGQLIYSQFFDSSEFDLLKGNTLVGWEGQNNKGLQLPSGAYYFLFEGTLADGTKPQPEKGIIYLLK